MRKINKQTGFTLIELIMVIVILGVLSAFALPRFADLGGNARAASINGLAASLKAASNIAHAQELANGGLHNDDVTLEGATVNMIGFYPTANATGIDVAAQVDTTNDYTAAGGGAGLAAARVYSLAGGSGNCQVTYTSASATSATVSTVVVDTTGCN
jgi:MSHA pilin protein MshA